MTVEALEQYVAGDTILHRAAPLVKVCACLAFLLTVVLCPNARWTRLWWLASVPMAGILVSRVPWRWVAVRLVVVAPFLLLALVSLPFVSRQPGESVWTIPHTSLVIPRSGAELFGAILFKSLLSLFTVALVLATTGFHRVVAALQQLHVPAVFVALLSFMYRYLFVLVEEAARLLRARDARAPTQRVVPRLVTTGHLAGSLFLRSYERAERVAQAMVSRGFTGVLRLPPQSAGTVGQWVAAAALAAACVVAVAWR